jgi:prepilin-type N-terminal cleavage/methylation domain-containing protein
MSLLFAARSELPRRAPKRGFTLIEVLVVIAIIALLIGILLPALSMARAEGQKAKCLANLRALGQAFATYSDDNEKNLTGPVVPKAECDWLYDGEYEYGGKTGLTVWSDIDFQAEVRPLNRFVFGDTRSSDFSMYRCPTDRGVPDAPVDFEPAFIDPQWSKRTIYDVTGTSYRLNNHIDFLGQTPYTDYFYGPYMRSKSRVPSTSETVLLEETIAERAKWNDQNVGTVGWHNKMNIFNVLFVDTHASVIYLRGQNNFSDPNYWILRGVTGERWRMDCSTDAPIKDLYCPNCPSYCN